MVVFGALKKLIWLLCGLFIFSIGLLFIIHAGLGASPWDTLHLGIILHTGLTLGQISQITGLSIIIINLFMKQIPGWGTLANMYCVGLFIDIINKYNLVPYPTGILSQLAFLVIGILMWGWATFSYINTGWGAGPRDSLMIGLSKIFSIPVWVSRTVLEVAVVMGGSALGVLPGIGTIAAALCIGPSIQLVYFITRKNPKAVKHRTFLDDYRFIASSMSRVGKSKVKY